MKHLKKFLMFLLALAMVIPLAACGGGGKKVDVQKLYTPKFTGLEGHGDVSMELNEKYLHSFFPKIKDWDDDDAFDKLSEKDQKKYMDMAEYLFKIDYKIKPKKSKRGSLKNGDTVTISFSDDESMRKKTGMSINKESYDVKVKDLDKGEEVELFDYLDYEIRGDIDGEGWIYTTTKDNDFDFYFSFTVEGENEDLHNGDKVTIKLDTSDSMARDGYVPKTLEKEIEVEGLKVLQELKAEDLMDMLVVKYTGASPLLEISLELDADSDIKDNIGISIENKNGNWKYAIGDECEIHFYGYYSLKEAGYSFPDDLTVDWTVPEDAPKYITALDQFPKAGRDEIVSEIKDTFKALEAEKTGGSVSWNDEYYYDCTVKFVDLEKVYFLTYKPSKIDNLWTHELNKLIFVGKYEIDPKDEEKQKFNAFMAVTLNPFYLDDKGTLVYDLSNIQKDYNFKPIETIKNDYVSTNVDNYTSEEASGKDFMK